MCEIMQNSVLKNINGGNVSQKYPTAGKTDG